MTAAQELVSIIVPVHNSERFLAETVASVLAQSYGAWELLLVDDGSTDGSVELAESLALQRPDAIRCLVQPGGPRGASAARNFGARNANGNLLAFLDSDDVWLPEKLSVQVTILEAHPEVALVYGHSEYWRDWDAEHTTGEPNSIPPLSPADRVYHPPELFTGSYPLGAWGAPCPSSFLVRRAAFEKVGGFDECFCPSTFQLYEDVAFFAKLALCEPIYVSSATWERYRVGPRSEWIRAQNTTTGETARRFYFRWLRRYLAAQHPVPAELVRLVNRRAWSNQLPLPPALVLFARRAMRGLQRRSRQPAALDAPKC